MTARSYVHAIAQWDHGEWREQAACKGKLDVFFPHVSYHAASERRGYDAYREARAICAECPVRAECLDFALTTNQGSG